MQIMLGTLLCHAYASTFMYLLGHVNDKYHGISTEFMSGMVKFLLPD